MGTNDNQRQFFLNRTIRKEKVKISPLNGVQDVKKSLQRAVSTILVAPGLTIIILWCLELSKMTTVESAWRVAIFNVLESADFIFLVFSLALAVIIEWILSEDKWKKSFLLISEIGFAIFAICLYTLEESSQDLANSALMGYRTSIHPILILAVILVAALEYIQRYRMYLSHNA